MDVILNFVALRPRPQDSRSTVSLAAETDFQYALAEAAAAPDAGTRVASLASDFASSRRFVRAPRDVDLGAELEELSARIETAEPDAVSHLAETFLREYEGGDWQSGLQRAQDSVLAAYLSDGSSRQAAFAQKLVRVGAVLDAVKQGDMTGAKLTGLLRGPLVLPPALERVGRDPGQGSGAESGSSADEAAKALLEQLTAALRRREDLDAALDALDSHDEDELLLSEFGEKRGLAALYRSPLPGFAVSREALAGASPGREQRLPGAGLAEQEDPRPDLVDASQSKPLRLGPSLESSPLRRAAARSNVVLSDKALRLLPESTRAVLGELSIDPASASLREMTSRVMAEHQAATQTVRSLTIKVGEITSALSPSIRAIIESALGRYRLDPIDEPPASEPVATAAPATFNIVKPLGVADLLLVRSHLLAYERGEVAAIENVVAHEKLTHTVSRAEQTETIDTTESERIDLQSLAQSAAEQVNDKTVAQALGSGRGPLTTDGPANFSKQVTDLVSSSASSRARRSSNLRQTNTRSETLEHVFDNSAGAQVQYGVYQWLDRIYQAQIFGYGPRLLYDLIMPEPAALFLEALARPRGQSPLPPRPAKFTLRPDQLDADNWSYYATGHQASGVEPPPQDRITVSEVFGGKAPDPFSGLLNSNTYEAAESRTTLIPKGYKATGFRVLAIASGWNPYVIRAFVGTKTVDIGDAWRGKVFSGKLDGEVEKIPVGLIVDGDGGNPGVSTLAVGVEITCEPTDAAIAAWQTKSHCAILAGNQRRLADYAERVATRDGGARLQLQALTDAQKAVIMSTELKRTALAVLTGQNFGGFNAELVDGYGFPYPSTGAVNALSPYIRFFEQAIEWQHLQCAFLPYFWGSRASWVSKLLTGEANPSFAAFLTSGAARVVLSVRPGYEKAFERFLNTGKVPTTDDLLDVGGPLWVSLVQQLHDHANPEGKEVAVGQPWRFRVASPLMRLRKDGQLPRWTLTNNEWVEDGDPHS